MWSSLPVPYRCKIAWPSHIYTESIGQSLYYYIEYQHFICAVLLCWLCRSGLLLVRFCRRLIFVELRHREHAECVKQPTIAKCTSYSMQRKSPEISQKADFYRFICEQNRTLWPYCDHSSAKKWTRVRNSLVFRSTKRRRRNKKTNSFSGTCVCDTDLVYQRRSPSTRTRPQHTYSRIAISIAQNVAHKWINTPFRKYAVSLRLSVHNFYCISLVLVTY